MSNTELIHESTLVGAVDSYLKELVHIRPFLLQRYATILEEMTEKWLNEVGMNQLGALEPKWLINFMEGSSNQGLTMNALQDFCRWAVERHLLIENPVAKLIV